MMITVTLVSRSMARDQDPPLGHHPVIDPWYEQMDGATSTQCREPKHIAQATLDLLTRP